jgi:hypothetical protein
VVGERNRIRLLARPGLFPLVKIIERPWNASPKAGLVSTSSAGALMVEKLILMFFAQPAPVPPLPPGPTPEE